MTPGCEYADQILSSSCFASFLLNLSPSFNFLIMSSCFSNDSSLADLGLTIWISGTMWHSFDQSCLDQKWGEAFPLEYMVVSPNTWLCLGVPAGKVDYETWYYGRERVWFSIGLPVSIWKDAVVVASSVPDHVLVIPDHFYHLPIPKKYCFKQFLMGQWFPSAHKVCYSSSSFLEDSPF